MVVVVMMEDVHRQGKAKHNKIIPNGLEVTVCSWPYFPGL